jgi:hypothetical protein
LAGSVAGCKIGLGPAEAPASAIAGQVTLASSTPVANATVKVTGNGELKTSQTGSDGKYNVGSLAGGYFLVEVVPPAGYAVADSTYGVVPVQLAGNDSKTVNFRLKTVVTTGSTSVPPQARE